MTGKERLLAAIRQENMDRHPWIPYIGIHGAGLAGMTVDRYMRDGEAMLEGIGQTVAQYDPDGVLVAFDLQAEAEALGCGLKWYHDAPPSVVSHPCSMARVFPSQEKISEVLNRGRLPMMFDLASAVVNRFGGDRAIYGLVTGPLTLAAHLRGEDFMMDIVLNETYIKEMIDRTTEVAKKMIEAYGAAGVDVIALVDPMASQISPEHFDRLIGESLGQLFESIRKEGCASSLFVCGCVDKQIEPMCRTKPDMVSIDEHTDLARALKVCHDHGIAVSGNIPVTTLLLHGTVRENCDYVGKLAEACGNKGGFILSTGCDVPYDVPPANIKAIGAALKTVN